MIMPKAWVSDESVMRNEKSPSENRWYAPSTKTARHIHEAAPMLRAVGRRREHKGRPAP